ncbi:hypothetical protein [Lactobacillus taiwanensis]|uniref:hypothetical protein n=1 Tax=Lactobacillus taiwanensis TaxID=508451 RepID=UPI00321FD917
MGFILLGIFLVVFLCADFEGKITFSKTDKYLIISCSLISTITFILIGWTELGFVATIQLLGFIFGLLLLCCVAFSGRGSGD